MNICFFSAMYLPHTGGVERYTANMAEYLTRQGHHVIIVTSRQDSQLATRYTQNNITIIQAKSVWVVKERMPFLTPAGEKEITSWLDQYAIDRIVIQTRLYPVSLFGMQYAVKRNIPFLTIDHGSDYVIHQGIIAPVEHLYEKYLLQRARRLCHHWYAVSRSGIVWLRHLGIEPDGILYNFIDPAEISRTDGADVREIDHHFHPERTNIAYCGRLIPEKGILNLIQAVQQNNLRSGQRGKGSRQNKPEAGQGEKDIPVNSGAGQGGTESRQNKPEAGQGEKDIPINSMAGQTGKDRQHLYIIGMGPLSEEVARIARKDRNITYLGGQPHQNVLTLLHACDCFCLPSDYPEGLPTVVLEAALCDCYLIATNKGGTKEVIRSQAYGALLPSNEPAVIASALRSAIESPARAQECRKNAHQLVLQEFSIASTAAKLVAALEKLEN